MNVVKRFEHKYIISYVDYLSLKAQISSMLTHDKHGDRESYNIISIYLDDIVHSGAADKAFGNELHRKYRIRYYDSSDKMKLELKEKIGEESTKFSTVISEELYNAILTQDMDVLEQHKNDELIRKYMLSMLRFNLTPKLVIGYDREAYRDETDNLRITFDHALNCDHYFEGDVKADHQLLQSTKMILEVKYEHFLPKEIKVILNKYKLNQIAYSKYFMGYSALY